MGRPRKFTDEQMLDVLAESPSMQAAVGKLGVTPSCLTYRIKRHGVAVPDGWIGSKAKDPGGAPWTAPAEPSASMDLLRREISTLDQMQCALGALPDDESRRRVLTHLSAATQPLYANY